MRTTELRLAYAWTCDDCGRDNFVQTHTAQLSRDELKDALVQLGELEDWQEVPEGQGMCFQERPESVICDHCGSEFHVEKPDEE